MTQKIYFRFFLICSLCMSLSAIRAQNIAISDTNWGNWLFAHGDSTCLSGSAALGWQLDTTCAALALTVDIDCSGDSIRDLTGIQYFPNLENLYCDRNVLTSLPLLPASLTYVNCGFNQLSSIPVLPGSLLTLECAYNQLTTLPTLPNTITQINCSNNLITSLPALPASLQGLICANNSLTSLPALPATLISMDCSYNSLSSLPALPSMLFNLLCENNMITALQIPDDSLRFLNCSNNMLNALPAPPPLLITLDCSFNQLTSLPAPDSNMTTLNCENNQLATLPALPDTLTGLNCSYNLLTSLPPLPYSLTDLNCSYNTALSCLPVIYQNPVNSFYIDSTNIQCLPDLFSARYFDMNPDSMPQCTAASGCPYTNYTGVATLTGANIVELYPNPNRGSFTLKITGQAINDGIGSGYTICDMLGTIIAHGVISSGNQVIDISDASGGIYILTVNGVQPIRFTVVR